MLYAARGCACAILISLVSGCGLSLGTIQALDSKREAAQARHQVLHPVSAVRVDDLRVMSFNLRVRTVFDFHNGWAMRRDLLMDTIRQFAPDLLGTQECLASQAQYLRKGLPGYGFVGAGRNDGRQRGEMCAIFYKTSLFEKLDEGHFWLSETPDEPGSRSWGAAFPRMASWVKLRPRMGGQTFYFFNTHLDHSSSRARIEGASLLQQKIARITRGAPVIVAGDFNTGEASLPYHTLMRPRISSNDVRLIDTYRAVVPTPSAHEGTRHGFRGGTGGDRIDWILACTRFTPVDAEIVRFNDRGRFPSDHFPVTAVLRMRSTLAARDRTQLGG